MSNVDLNYINKLTPKNMADNTHHVVTDNAQKLVSLEALKRYNHGLISQLGLTNDTALYAYESTDGKTDVHDASRNIDVKSKDADGKENWLKATNVKQALDQLFDLVANNQLEVGSGKIVKTATSGASEGSEKVVADAVIKEATFTRNTADTTNDIYYVNVKTGDNEYTNIKLDASAFTKDGVLDTARVVYSNATSVSQIDGTDKDALPEGVVITRGEGASRKANSFIELIVKNAKDEDAAQTYSFMFINTKDLIGDLVGGDGIEIDGLDINVDLGTADPYVVLSIDENDQLIATTHVGEIGVSGTYHNESSATAGDDTTKLPKSNISVDAKTSISFGNPDVTEGDNKQVNVATTKQVTETANFLQKEIEALAGNQSTVAGDGNVTYGVYEGSETEYAENLAAAVGVADTDASKKEIVNATNGAKGGVVVTKTTDKGTGAVEYNVYTVVANDDDIDGIFTTHA